MKRICLPLLLLLLPIAAWLSARAATPVAGAACAAPADFLVPDDRFHHVAAALAAHEPLAILAVGSGSTVGGKNGGTPFPYHMVEALRAALPGRQLLLTVRGGRYMTAEDMLPLLTQALQTRHYALVLWQTGTVEAVQGLRPETMRETLEAGVNAVQEAHGDVILIDPQFSRFLRANADLDPYETVLEQVALLPGVALFHRFDLMHSWAMSGAIDLERARRAERDEVVGTLNRCLGEALARFVMNGIEPPEKGVRYSE